MRECVARYCETMPAIATAVPFKVCQESVRLNQAVFQLQVAQRGSVEAFLRSIRGLLAPCHFDRGRWRKAVEGGRASAAGSAVCIQLRKQSKKGLTRFLKAGSQLLMVLRLFALSVTCNASLMLMPAHNSPSRQHVALQCASVCATAAALLLRDAARDPASAPRGIFFPIVPRAASPSCATQG